ncbi:MAG: YbhB/YbcL family Raf kinase inhibitor-like protein [Proteobacteria bacterium]|nr:YbhB/YbcL family Raf kinase inhibitor-like protein [Pseudomonadota bacterium]
MPHLRPLAPAVLALMALGACHKNDAASASRTAPTSGAARSSGPSHDTSASLAVNEVAAKQPGAVNLTSSAFQPNSAIPDQFAAQGQNTSPPLSWSPDPAAKAYALIVEDPNAPTPKPFVHWVVWNIAANVHELPVGISEAPVTVQPMTQGVNGAKQAVWHGPQPPKGDGAHHYHFQLFALDTPLNLPAGSGRDAVVAAMKGHVVGQADLVGVYETK